MDAAEWIAQARQVMAEVEALGVDWERSARLHALIAAQPQVWRPLPNASGYGQAERIRVWDSLLYVYPNGDNPPCDILPPNQRLCQLTPPVGEEPPNP